MTYWQELNEKRRSNPEFCQREREWRRKYYQKNRDTLRAKARKQVNTLNEENKIAVVNVLTNGEGTCRGCGQGDIDVLTIDHIENNGADHRRRGVYAGGAIYRWIIANDYPPGLQVLCFNCNFKKEILRRRESRKQC